VVGSALPVRYLLDDPLQVRGDSLLAIWGFTGLAAGSILFVGALVALLMIVGGSRRRAPAPAQAQWMAAHRQPMSAQARPALARPRGRHANGTCLSCAQTNALAATCCVACGAPFPACAIDEGEFTGTFAVSAPTIADVHRRDGACCCRERQPSPPTERRGNPRPARDAGCRRAAQQPGAGGRGAPRSARAQAARRRPWW